MAQPWPAWVITWKAVLPTPVSRSASSRTMAADLPPSSRKTRVRLAAAAVMTFWPVAVEPVKDTTSTRGSDESRAPMAWSAEATTLSTPGGRSVSSVAIRPRSVAVHGVSGAGLSTTVQPAASAGATLARLICMGKFHGVTAPTTPAASRRTERRDSMPKCVDRPMSCSHT